MSGEAIWYYVDRGQQRIGPVKAADVAEAHRVGLIDDQSLVWREGLGAWTPLGNHRADLGILGPPTVLPPASLAPPPPRTTGMSRGTGCLLIGAALLIVGVPILAILAAIALPAYQDYVARAHAVSALAEIRGGVVAYEEAIHREVGGAATPEAIALAGYGTRCREIFTEGDFSRAGGPHAIGCVVAGNPALDGATLRLERSGEGNWSCLASGIRDKHLPSGCRNE